MPSRSPALTCVYLILSHTAPQGVARLARAICGQSAAARVLIHHDAGAGPFPRTLLAGMPRVDVVADPAHVRWGGFSQVDATLRSLRQLTRDGTAYDWVALISGQDYPARPIADFESMLAAASADALMTFDPVTEQTRHLEDRYRFHYRRVLDGPLPRLLRMRQWYDTVFNRLQPFVRIQTDRRGTFIGRRPRTSAMDLGMCVYKGWSWWALSRGAVQTVLAAIGERPEIVTAFDGTLSPDESLFQTIVLNAGNLTARNVSLHYADWTLQQSGPRFLGLGDLEAIRASRQWFARKIDAARDGGLRDALDARNGPSPN